ncbi:hypothetical protein A3I27_01610 [Candidatus Giovannonibacteria bacterium RIFCSPLOWO2_02_FULL_43_11b]|uniref:Uncharacterized protein n=1 Tax=Candidatus Giovannonibacteria bacterium RIFCSPHIGHO2_12_FULL_43_15 TaxID=1798341 RepID=A0A1F5WP11_9BACT|nr:MAG: hypothetical protein A2739_01085 [Candidatus Giovannonibacteria bacterium RIFCSPHIGHO2_01_FULL_43_100]OGF66453.1 MAG: hypothetical protein A3B97_03885 [Candidatus Giovannonibacteria bacterium RIFCSPHIGHO2_02_FULL_43_32]OGF77398.1 MAG: hypothetical protein A3F23_03670 [Candidatus Giovannonibacteria bacterium RIFCSPHIGHO2_12_FULL_43_15]OGF78424.1 MAG: hypothetical protein A3A15_03460 [Candidatus Giovannonibacteria bacterium RIFCSPLOWO2_01_FULL_43_60]OGF89783.1 MAG: hypothetical protein A3
MQYVLKPWHSQLFLQSLVGPFGSVEEARYALTSSGFVKTPALTYFHPKLMATFHLCEFDTPSQFATVVQRMAKTGITGSELRIEPFYK